MEMSGLLVASAAFPMGKEPIVLIEWKAVWTSHMVWMLWRIGKSLAMSGIKPQCLDCPACCIVTLPVEMFPMEEKIFVVVRAVY